jgi:Ca2+-transporting ATPase
MSDDDLRVAAQQVNVFARVVPEQKLRLVNALKANGQVVAMTGDGVNDAPALKAAHIGIAMGRRGSDVAREASSLVLLEDDFMSIVEAVRLGRRIYDNIQRAMAYIVAVHIPTAGMALVPLLFGWPLVLFPVHVVFLEFVIDPACSIVFEAEPADRAAMRRPPRKAGSRLFGAAMLTKAAMQGLGVLAGVALLYALAQQDSVPEGQARAMVFAAIVFGNIGLLFATRSRMPLSTGDLRSANPTLWWLVAGALAGLAAALFIEPVSELFRFVAPTLPQLAAAAIAGIAGLATAELVARLLPTSQRAAARAE